MTSLRGGYIVFAGSFGYLIYYHATSASGEAWKAGNIDITGKGGVVIRSVRIPRSLGRLLAGRLPRRAYGGGGFLFFNSGVHYIPRAAFKRWYNTRDPVVYTVVWLRRRVVRGWK